MNGEAEGKSDFDGHGRSMISKIILVELLWSETLKDDCVYLKYSSCESIQKLFSVVVSHVM